MLRVELKEDDISAGLQLISERLTDMTPLMQDIGEVLLYGAEERFKAGVDPDGQPWAAKSPVTIENYRRRGDTVSFRPLIGPTKVLSSTISVRTGADFVDIGSNAVQAAVMQFGAAKGAFGANKAGRPIPWGDIPARPFLGFSASDRAGVMDAIEEWLERLAAGQD